MVWPAQETAISQLASTSPVGQNIGKVLIELNQVHKDYKNPAGIFQALKGITTQVNTGEFVCIIGKSGAGKTTLVNMITGVDSLTSGEICVGGISVGGMNEDQLASWRGRNLGIIFQTFELMPMLSLIENVMLPMDFCGLYHPRRSRERAIELLNLVELGDQVKKQPGAISGGQQQRVAIARALANDPPILIADEPTGRLDSVTADTINQIFKRLIDQGKTIVMVTHDASATLMASRVIEIADGEIIDDYMQEPG
jgi:putative ABC transport system ATP-binding protein